MFSDFSPFHDYNGSYSPYGSMRSQKLQQQRRQRALEAERRRRAEWQWRQRQLREQDEKRKQEELRRQREKEYLHYLMMMEDVKKKKQMRSSEAIGLDGKQQHKGTDTQGYQTQDKKTQQTPTIVRGSNGRLYYIMPSKKDDINQTRYFKKDDPMYQKQIQKPSDTIRQSFSNSGNGLTNSLEESRPKTRNEYQTTFGNIEKSTDSSYISNNAGDNMDWTPTMETNVPSNESTVYTPNNEVKRSKPSPVTVVEVEDASDDESDDDLKSIWRNLRPSEGEWMEPVDYYL
mmetsp:Transcript_67276/g.99732  ORF Transcript_67276/g.99732 Transcript_67276/m.99732 type:complete len:288 (+) Transcript_67276:34-897(+)